MLFVVKTSFKTKESYNFKIALTKLFFTNARKLIKGYDLLECFCLKQKKIAAFYVKTINQVIETWTETLQQ